MNESKFVTWCDRIIVFSFYALIYFLPISKALIEIFSTFIITSFFVKRGYFFWCGLKDFGEQDSQGSIKSCGMLFFQTFKPVKNPINILMGIFLLVNILSVVFSQYTELGIKGFIYKLFQGVVLLYAFIECMKTKKQIKIFSTIMLIGGTLITISGLLQFFKGKGIVHGHTLVDGRVVSAFEHPNDLGGYLVIVTMVLLCLALNVVFRWKPHQGTTGPRKKFLVVGGEIGLSLLSLAFVVCLALTFSRSAWMGFIAALLFVGLKKREFFFVSIMIITLFLMLSVPQLKTIRNVSFLSDDVMHAKPIDMRGKIIEYFKREEDVSSGEQSSTTMTNHIKTVDNTKNISKVSTLGKVGKLRELFLRAKQFAIKFGGMGRVGFWKEAVSMIKDYPLLGVGLNAYSEVAPRYKVNWGGYPHNCYLHMAVEIGFLGLLFFLWILGRIFRMALKFLKTTKDSYLEALMLGLISGFGAFLFQSFFDTNFYSVKLGSLMWVIMGLIVAVGQINLCAKKNQ